MVLSGSSDRAGGDWRSGIAGFLRHADGVGTQEEIPMAIPSLICFVAVVGLAWVYVGITHLAIIAFQAIATLRTMRWEW